ncbi:MAG TPA: hypothetical protein VNO52_11330 [Methylomirabilota bacterium]|nr:hypothetical protein [Methylomirabilota bacterium]
MKPKAYDPKKTLRGVAACGKVPMDIAARHAFLGRRILSELRILMRLALSAESRPGRQGSLAGHDVALN